MMQSSNTFWNSSPQEEFSSRFLKLNFLHLFPALYDRYCPDWVLHHDLLLHIALYCYVRSKNYYSQHYCALKCKLCVTLVLNHSKAVHGKHSKLRSLSFHSSSPHIEWCSVRVIRIYSFPGCLNCPENAM